MIEAFGEREVRQQHGHDYAGEQDDALCPRLVSECFSSMIKIPYSLGPGVDRYKSHSI